MIQDGWETLLNIQDATASGYVTNMQMGGFLLNLNYSSVGASAEDFGLLQMNLLESLNCEM